MLRRFEYRSAFWCTISVALMASPAVAFRGGPPAGANGSIASFGNTCRACHGNAVGAGSVQILGVPANYSANQVYNISVRVADPAKLGAGFQVSVEDAAGTHRGTLILVNATHTQHNGGWVNHTLAGVNNAVANWAANSQSATYDVQWQAPASNVGTLTFWAAGNAINNNFANSGDTIYLTSVNSAFGVPTGACCDDLTGLCDVGATQAVCEGAGRRYGGDGSTCATIDPPCVPPATGACCDDVPADCSENVTQATCEGAGNRYGGDSSTCATIDPPCIPPGTGACCEDPRGVCTDGVTQAVCEGNGFRYGGDDSSCATLDPPCDASIAISLQPLVTGLSSPVDLTHAGDGSGRIFIVDQIGQIRVVDAGGTLLATPFLDISSLIPPPNAFFDERGLLGLAFHPDYETNGRFFIRYSKPRAGLPEEPCNDPEGFIVGCHEEILAEYSVLGDPATSNVADPNSEVILYRADKPQFNHNSGQVAFGPDGYLYFTLGDGGGAHDGLADGDPPGSAPSHGPIGNGQNRFAKLGKMHRIDVDAAPEPPYPFAIPDDNPFADGVDGLPEIYAYGLRNAFKFSFDDGVGGDGTLWLPDVGQNLYEEVNIGALGTNYGWVIREAAHCFDPFNPVTPPGSCPTTGALGEPLVDPVMEYLHSIPCTMDAECAPLGVGCDESAGQCENEGGISIIGGFVYRGSAVPELSGKYVFGDFSDAFFAPDGRLYYMDISGPDAYVRKQFYLSPSNDALGQFLKGYGEDGDGELYVLVSTQLGPLGNAGSVLRIAPSFASSPVADPSGFDKSRFISFATTPTLVSGEVETALRVRLSTLHSVSPPYTGGPTVPFSAFEGESVWVGQPQGYVESASNPIPFTAATTNCTPHYRDWSTISILHVTGPHIVPSSVYHVESVPALCEGLENTPACSTGGSRVSEALQIRTTRWGDVAVPFNPPSATVQPDVGDISAEVDKFRSAPGSLIKARALLSGFAGNAWGEITPALLTVDLGFSHISACVDAFRGLPYRYKMGKCTGSPTPPNDGECTTDTDCTGGNGAGPCLLYCP